jgi:ATP-binding cassette, subfamily B, bacterial
VLHAHRIYVLERGRIVEYSRHEELLDRKGLSYAMWRQQVGEARWGGRPRPQADPWLACVDH